MRLNKFLAQKGLCSRREADKLILEKLIKVNNCEISPGYILEAGDKVVVFDSQATEINNFIYSETKAQEFEKVYLALNKAAGIECTCNLKIKANIISYIRKAKGFEKLRKKYQDRHQSELRLFHIGRLDKDSRGLILLSNDGDLSQKLMHPSYEHEKEYLVCVDKKITQSFIKDLSAGVEISRDKKDDKVKTLPCIVKQVNDRSFTIILTQGYKRQIRKSCKVLGYEVTDLYRFRIGEININENYKIAEGEFLKLPSLAG